MSTSESSSWSDFHKAALAAAPRELLVRTLNFFSVEGRKPTVAVDLGCGSGRDTRELLRRGWHVHAVDAEPAGLELLRQSVPTDVQARLELHPTRFEAFAFPPCDLIWAGFALPFCQASEWPSLIARAVAALKPGGRIAGDLFGDRHAWASAAGVHTLTEAQVRAALQPLALEALDIEDGYRVSGGEVTRWHAFGFAARKPGEPGSPS